VQQICPFCDIDPARMAGADELVFAIRDGFPISPGHMLIIPRRHIASFFDATSAERTSLLELLDVARNRLVEEFAPAGFNIGINDGPAAGQTVPHLHIHLIPRFAGDSADPRGGVRWVIPTFADYWSRT